ncbi:hypothetical protein [Photobacterium chitinilyticum]|uniref:Lipoprotein n=1 Tax=Photobacterium chitinilyticum TaxID=2485123 RepID=A0A444JIQ3_9GAMM|nr:hypothetical protein [Photobacterium chitinilyticum]RWX52949.1 hypothetical protein EDI28_24280 [Photobacterium chitinilyticum]
MKRIICLCSCLFLWGCASAGNAPQELTLFFSPEQVSLTAEQNRKIATFLNNNPYHQLTASVAPAALDDPFKALVQGQKRIQAVNQISNDREIPLLLKYTPKQTADTLILKRQ